jgi:Ca2+-binding RTX toxin-like protein
LEDYTSLTIAFGLWSALPSATAQRGVIEIATVLTGNDSLDGGTGNDTLVGGVGNDMLNGGTETDTADYSSLTQAITLLPTGVVNKGTAGTDNLISVERIIGATGLANVIDASTATNFGAAATVNINLATQSVVVTTGIATPPSISLTAINFVNAIGTNNNDTITGDTANNTLSGGGSNDILNGCGGNDQIFGDINSTSPTFNYNGKSYLLSSAGTWTQAQAQAVSFGGNLVTVNDAAENQFLVNTVGNLNRWIGLTDEVVEGQFKWVNGEAVTYTNWIPGQPDNAGGNQDYVYIDSTQKRWDDFGIGTAQGIIEIQSNDTIIGSTGNDTINGGVGIDTANYSAIGQAITLLPTGTVNKGTAGIDQLIKVETIIGATGLINVIDNSSATGATTINANLGTQSLVVNADGLPTPLSFTVTNFVNVIGTNNNDTITGDTANNTLSGGGGNDQIFGGAGNDFLAGNQGNDLLTGGLGNDIFATALGLGSDTIQDFQDGFDKIGLGGGLLFTQLGISQLGANTLIRNTSNAELLFTLQNVSSALITSADFVTV